MVIDFFLWPLLVPLVLLFVYAVFRYRQVLPFSYAMLVSGICIVVLYMPLISLDFFESLNYIFVKYLLFILVPFIVLIFFTKKPVKRLLFLSGLRKKGLRDSVFFCMVFLPVMLFVSGVLAYSFGTFSQVSLATGVVSFFESFSEEFFFRGILFLVLLIYVDVKVAYVVSLVSFVLVHPQHLASLFIFSTIIQGVLTLEIVRRSNNLMGAWLLHGVNRVFLLLVIPFIFG